MDYEAVIGLETHVQLKTKSKMWCGCANEFGAPPNTRVCPVCLGMPGVLPVPNDEALRLTALTGLLLNCTIPRYAKFDRKSYFYPDMPKNYQITQYDKPSTINGFVEFEFNGGIARVRITRAHLEEDVGKNFHFERNSGIDFNRAGVPLMEIVSEPDLTSADMAYEYLNALKDILFHGGVSDCDMEKGMVRCDVNISVRSKGTKELGAKIEIKNMNSFSGVRKALEYEISRQIAVVKNGGKLVQSTRRWDDVGGITEEMRTKEHAHDYRYFPDPDLMPIKPTDAQLNELKELAKHLNKNMPFARKQRLDQVQGLTEEDRSVLSNNVVYGDFFNFTREQGDHGNPIPEQLIKPSANIIANNVAAYLNEQGLFPIQLSVSKQALNENKWTLFTRNAKGEVRHFDIPPSGVFDLAKAIHLDHQISNSAAPIVIREMFETGKSPAAIVQEKGLAQVSDTNVIEKFCDEVIAANPGPANDFKSGKVAALNFLKGQVMKLSKGKANPVLVGEILERKLKA